MMMKRSKWAIPSFVRNNWILVTLISLLVALALVRTDGLSEILGYYRLVGWGTVGAMSGIIIITTAIKESRFLESVAVGILSKATSGRKLAIWLVILSALLSTFLTNDITLFVIVPLTMSLQSRIKNNISKVIIFEIFAVNAGSLLTPVGNPQNLFLWHKWGISFTSFVAQMFPLAAVLVILLLAFVWLAFDERKLVVVSDADCHHDRKLVVVSLVLLLGYLTAFELKCALYVLPIIVITYVIINRRVLRRVDWPVLIIFILMFIDFRLISGFGPIVQLMAQLDQTSSGSVFAYSLLISQVISNVPAAVFMSRFSCNWQAIAYGVNAGGNGLVIASLANLIALRMAGDRSMWLKFHRYSIAYLLVSAGAVYFLLYSHMAHWLASNLPAYAIR